MGLISKKAVKDLLTRSVVSLDSLKNLAPDELDKRLKEAKAAKWTSEPMHHQKVGVLGGLLTPTIFLVFDPGLGKTYTSIQILQTRKAAGQVQKCLVLVPGVTNIGAWEEELKLYAPELKAKGFYKMTKVEKEEALDKDYDVIIMTYMGWISALEVRKKKNAKREINTDHMEAIESKFQMVIWDESDALKEVTSITTKLAIRLSKSVPYRICLSGTPFDKNPIDLWSQVYILDGGKALGESITLFRKTFCVPKYNPFSGGLDYRFNSSKTKLLSDRLKSVALIYKEKDCLDLPDTVGGILSPNFMVRPVPFPDENKKQYLDVIYSLKKGSSHEVIKNVYIKLRQSTAGYISLSDDETNTRNYIDFDKNPKIDALLQILKEIPEEDKVIVFCEFIYSGHLVEEALKKEKYQYVRVYSKTKDKNAAIDQFKTNPKTRILLASRSVCYGLNIQGANRIIMFESPDSTIKRQQLERRIRRKGQTKKTYIYDIVVIQSVDQKILDSLRVGKRVIDEVLKSDDPQKELLK